MQIEQVTVQAFRAFGVQCEPIDIGSPLAVVWGPNSEGKTSFAEALEFLFTGDIARRELLASARDEFANALRNVHADEETPTFVEAAISHGGGRHVVRRTLTRDFTKRQACESKLEIDGQVVGEEGLASIGLQLAEPPLAAPILMQHTLGYLFSAQPKQRSGYFKALLEVGDLDDVRTRLATLGDQLREPASDVLSAVDRCLSLPAFEDRLALLGETAPSEQVLLSTLEDVARGLLADADVEVPDSAELCLDEVERVAGERISRVFPLEGFRRRAGTLGDWSAVQDETWEQLEAYADALAEVEEETSRLAGLFEKVLELPQVVDAEGPLDCPVCESAAALMPDRVAKLRGAVAKASGLRQAEERARVSLQRVEATVQSASDATLEACPAFMAWGHSKRAAEGFRTHRLPGLVDDGVRPQLDEWFGAARVLLQEKRRLDVAAANVRAKTRRVAADGPTRDLVAGLKVAMNDLQMQHSRVAEGLAAYAKVAAILEEPLKRGVEEQSAVAGWSQFVLIAREPSTSRAALVDRWAHRALVKEVEEACRQVEDAKEAVLNGKFSDLAEDVRTWWDLLRPGEHSFFSNMGMRAGAQRTIDFKAGLATSDERVDPEIRDAVAVFSQSQLVCLGLSTFLARAAVDGGFIVLDDPITSIDDDYSVHFIDGVLAELQARGVQVIMLTYEQKTWKAIQQRYQDGECEAFELNLDVPKDGTAVIKSNDGLSSMLESAKPFTRSSRLSTRKEGCKRLRDAAERFCKELLVKERREAGDQAALITDYTGPKGQLGNLIDECVPLMAGRDEPGKLRFLKNLINEGNHDGDVPPRGTLTNCLGHLKKLRGSYLVS